MTTKSWEQGGQQCLQIRLSDRWLLVVNSSLNDVEMTLPEGGWTCVAPFDNEQQNVRESSSWRATAKTLCVLTQG